MIKIFFSDNKNLQDKLIISFCIIVQIEIYKSFVKIINNIMVCSIYKNVQININISFFLKGSNQSHIGTLNLPQSCETLTKNTKDIT